MTDKLDKKFVAKFESLLDHNPTDSEFKKLTGYNLNSYGINHYKNGLSAAFMGYADIGYLYLLRNDFSMFKKYKLLHSKFAPKVKC